MATTPLATPADALQFLRARGCTALRADSRRVQPGEAFVAWPGQASDGRRYVPQALAAGAAACLVEAAGVEAFGLHDARIAALSGLRGAAGPMAAAFHGQPSARLDVVATTGTNGKTSTAWFVAQALTLLGRRAAVIGTLGIGEPGGALVDSGLTTPDPLTLQAALADFVARGLQACAIEASSIGLEQQRLAGTQIAVALFTNFTRDHLDVHGSMQAYWEAKRALFDWVGLRAAAINVDDAQGQRLAGELGGRGLDLWTVSRQRPARLAARALRHAEGGLAFELVEGTAAVAVQSALVGDYNVDNLLLVAAALRALGFALADIGAVLPRLAPVPGRLQRADDGRGDEPAVLIDYAHTPDALEQVLRALRPLAQARGGRLWCVFGCGGNRDATKRPLMGAIAERQADEVVLTSDNPRDEPPALILAQILAGMHEVAAHAAPAVIEDRAEAIADAVQRAAAADVVLLAGKGHEAQQEVAGVKRPFSDLEVARSALRRRAGRGGS
ncbi:MAG: UDP-N-acetylmuramoyl-L-alanyl-D-glutamate--2,6-diaminopimelate ligase [Rubrivivax sp. SCN 71-131]|jgi:UDP-N-acetylmuramoyl-L-alanyl-D-glutamate--2,6-diaminopimelate ligase|nr:MAG: UDP-N-acetylmuramoyl-L-alanyl-D-glutamate--2,6-diaminopimelate ligase [Rubrivivax sp. SCN 71-131]